MPKRPQEMTVVPLPPADVMPTLSADGRSRRTRVVVMPSAESASSRAAGLAQVAAGSVEALLGGGDVEVIDRSKGNALQDEIKLADTLGDGSSKPYTGPEVADYAISVVMGNAAYSSDFVAPTRSVNKDTGKVTETPGGHTHSARSVMTVRIYQLPSLRLVSSVPVTGTERKFLQPRAITASEGTALMRAATEDGISDARGPVLNEFAPKGYVSERRVHEKVSYFRILLGREAGVKTGQDVVIYTVERSTDPLTKRVTTTDARVAGGRVSNLVSDEYSYVVVDNEEEARRVRLGDVVRVKFDVAFWERIKIPKLF